METVGFREGDKVLIRPNSSPDAKCVETMQGIVIDVETHRSHVGVEFDTELKSSGGVSFGHNCDGRGKGRCCWYVEREVCTILFANHRAELLKSDQSKRGVGTVR